MRATEYRHLIVKEIPLRQMLLNHSFGMYLERG